MKVTIFRGKSLMIYQALSRSPLFSKTQRKRNNNLAGKLNKKYQRMGKKRHQRSRRCSGNMFPHKRTCLECVMRKQVCSLRFDVSIRMLLRGKSATKMVGMEGALKMHIRGPNGLYWLTILFSSVLLFFGVEIFAE